MFLFFFVHTHTSECTAEDLLKSRHLLGHDLNSLTTALARLPQKSQTDSCVCVSACTHTHKPRCNYPDVGHEWQRMSKKCDLAAQAQKKEAATLPQMITLMLNAAIMIPLEFFRSGCHARSDLLVSSAAVRSE